MIERLMADPDAPDLGGRILGQEAFGGSQGGLVDDLPAIPYVDCHDLALVCGLDPFTNPGLVKLVT